jgi:hypothetical protein
MLGVPAPAGVHVGSLPCPAGAAWSRLASSTLCAMLGSPPGQLPVAVHARHAAGLPGLWGNEQGTNMGVCGLISSNVSVVFPVR